MSQYQGREWHLDCPLTGEDIDQLNVGDLVHVTVSLRSLGVGEIENVAIVDALPAGLEIENSRLATSAKNSSAANNKPDHVEFLDDRAVLFATAKRREQEFHYQLRVTTSGIFRLPPIQASSMYDPECASVHGGGEVTVK